MNPSIPLRLERTTRADYLKRNTSLQSERSSWFEHHRELSQFILPRSGRFFRTDRNLGNKKHNSIYDSTGTRALRVLAAGMMAGMTSPARPWFRLGLQDKALEERDAVRKWLNATAILMRTVFAKSNTYRALHTNYEELGTFGTASTIVLPDYDNVLHCTSLTSGEYCITTDGKGNVNAMYREFEMQVNALLAEFGYDNASTMVQNAYNNGNLEAWVPVLHVIEPRADRPYDSKRNRDMPYKSCYFEMGTNESEKVLMESGFKRFPALCPRWAVSGGDIYGNSPGMECLGDIKQLQHEQYRKAQGIDYLTNPPLQAPAALKSEGVNKLPGGVSYYDSTGPQNAIKSLFDVRLDLSHLSADIMDIRERINKTFYVDLFLMLAQADTSSQPMTAREVAERHEEKLLMLGPVLERLHSELLMPLIDVTFDRLVEAKLLPPPPPEMHGMDLSVEFIGMLAQAQRAVGVTAVDRVIGTIGSIAQIQAASGLSVTALDKLDVDETVDMYADMLGIDPNLIISNDQVAIVRQQRAQAQAAAQKAAQAEQQSKTVKNLSDANANQPNGGMSDLMNQFSGYTIPVAQGAQA